MRVMMLLPLCAALLACPKEIRLCGAQDTCAATSMCVSGRCLPAEDAAVPAVEQSERIALRPLASENGGQGSEVRISDRTVWTLGFDLPASDKRVLEAYLLLKPLSRAPQSPIELRADDGADRALFPTRAGASVHVDPPSLSEPALVRVDVRDAVLRRMQRKSSGSQEISTLVLTLNGSGDGEGITFASTGAEEPVLEIYLRGPSTIE